MRLTSALLMGLIVLAAALSGCFGGGDDPPKKDTDGTVPTPTTTADLGAVKGQVMTTGLDEVNGATVALIQGEAIVQDATTDPGGRFVFNGVAPGEYRLQVSSICCKAAVKAVTVAAGNVAEVAFQLEPFSSDDLQEPFVKTWEWSGFISCGIGSSVASLAVCSAPGVVAEELADPNEEFFENFSVAKGIKTLSVGMTWDPVGGVSGTDFALSIEENVCEEPACADAYTYATLEGGPDLVVNIDNDDIGNSAFKWDNITDKAGLQFRVFAGGMASLIYQQPFTVHIHEFYWEEAPEGYSPIPDQ